MWKKKNTWAIKEIDVSVTMKVSWYMNELIARLHEDHPNKEWSGIAKVEKKDWYYLLSDILFCEQENSASNTEMTKEGLDSIAEKIMEVDPLNMHEWNCRLHSHHSMAVFWSGTDWEARNWFNDWNTKHWWSVVTSYQWGKMNYKCWLDVFIPTRLAFNVWIEVEQYSPDQIMRDRVEDYSSLETALESLKEVHLQEEQSLDIWSIDFSDFNGYLWDLLMWLDSTEVEDIVEDSKVSLLSKKRESLTKKYDRDRYEIISAFWWNIYDTKIKELKDNEIEKSAYIDWGYYWNTNHSKEWWFTKSKKKYWDKYNNLFD